MKLFNRVILVLFLLLLFNQLLQAQSNNCVPQYCIEVSFHPRGYYSDAWTIDGSSFQSTQVACTFLDQGRHVQCLHEVNSPPTPTPPPTPTLSTGRK